jgi:hypothetical protein
VTGLPWMKALRAWYSSLYAQLERGLEGHKLSSAMQDSPATLPRRLLAPSSRRKSARRAYNILIDAWGSGGVEGADHSRPSSAPLRLNGASGDKETIDVKATLTQK